MAADGGQILLRRKATDGGAVPEPPVSPARLLRRAVARAGTSLGCALSAIGIEDTELTLDTVLASLDDSQVLLALDRDGAAVGLAVADLDLRDVLVEVQTLGLVAPSGGGTPRPVTRADAALVQPLVDGILADLRQGGPGTDLPLWADGVEAGPRLATTRDIGATLKAGSYRHVRLSLDPGADGRQCGLTLLLPPAGLATESGDDTGGDARWSAALQDAVLEAPAALTAVLTRLRLDLARVEGFSVGQVLPLPGVTVASVVVESADRTPLGTARLGQVAGLRAVRLELPDTPALGSGLARRDRTEDALLVDGGAGSQAPDVDSPPEEPPEMALPEDDALPELPPMAEPDEPALEAPDEDLPDFSDMAMAEPMALDLGEDEEGPLM